MRQLFNDGWTFLKLAKEAVITDGYKAIESFIPVRLPHDFAIEKFETFYEDAKGFYRKVYNFSENNSEKNNSDRIILYFDGVYMDTEVYINRNKVYEWKYGYTPFEVDITDYVIEGDNEIIVTVSYLNPNSRWYSGAGITRNVWIDYVKDIYIPRDGIYANACISEKKDSWELTVDTEIVNKNADGTKPDISGLRLQHFWVKNPICRSATVNNEAFVNNGAIMNNKTSANDKASYDGETRLEKLSEEIIKSRYEEKASIEPADLEQAGIEQTNIEQTVIVRTRYRVTNPAIWDIVNPVTYTLQAVLAHRENNINYSTESTIFGFRTIDFKPDTGFWLNGRNIKLNGVCEHHDFGMVGGAFFADAFERKVINLKNMGVNSIRFSHNPVDPKALEICDRLGMLTMSEAFDMWEHKKTEYDYGRFFKEWHAKDVRAWVRQDRNHPCLIMWSIGNEIYDIHLSERGRELVNELSELVRIYDPLKNAFITFCSNYMPWENAQKAANDVEVVGYNYAEKYYREHHEKHPEWVIYGSETSSIVYSRGVYHFPLSSSCMSDDDRQCSVMGNSTTSWGAKNIESCICDDRDMDFSAGQYIWSGHDYLGEPTPYHTKNSYLGIIDTAGFPKDPYYVWKSAWTKVEDEPMIYVSPNWDYNHGQLIDIRVISNAYEVELFLNGISQGKRKLTHKKGSGKNIIADYRVKYEKGEICAVGYDCNGIEITRTTRCSHGDTYELVCEKQEYMLNGKPYTLGAYNDYGRHLEFYVVYAKDKAGNVVENASDLCEIEVSGAGVLLACDNGDSTDYSASGSNRRRLFNGKLLIVVERLSEGDIFVNVSRVLKDVPVRRINLLSEGETVLREDKRIAKVRAEILPRDASDKLLDFRLTDLFGNTTNIAEIIGIETDEQSGNSEILIKAIGDGAFQLRAMSKSGTDDVRIISQLDFLSEGIGTAFFNPYDFVAGSTYSLSFGTVGNGNERGVATARGEETVIVFENIDFGDNGSEIITIPIFALDFEIINIDIYDGKWGEKDCSLLCNGVYNHEKKWNVYQEESFRFYKKLKGVHTLSFRTTEKIHMKGFYCQEYNPAYEVQSAVDAKRIYGDTFVLSEDTVFDIGNNVTIDFGEMDFGKAGPGNLKIFGRAKNNRNTIHVRFEGKDGEIRNILECDNTEELCEKQFSVSGIKGKGSLQLIFLPGCQYDLKWIKFEK